MKVRLFNIILFCLPMVMLTAAPRTTEQALAIAQQFARQPMHAPSLRSSSGVTPAIAMPNSACYAVNSGTGFVLVGADDRLPEVLGWSEQEPYAEEKMPPALMSLMAMYAEELELMDAMSAGMQSAPARRYDDIVFDDEQAPLLTSTWGQGAPYNSYCPVVASGQRAATGCVATAMAQLMYYWQYPEQGKGEYSYTWKCPDCSVGYRQEYTLSADFGNTTYDWNNMLPSYPSNQYTTTEAAAVAKLMYHCGVAAEMEYGYKGSSSTIAKCADALVKYFGYGCDMRLINKSDIPADSMVRSVHDELAAGRPVLMRGRDSDTGGHEFVCDGFDQAGYFHINWGWFGTANGYFLLTALNPQSMSAQYYYNNDVRFLINVHPDPLDTAVYENRLSIDKFYITPLTSPRHRRLAGNVTELRQRGFGPFEGWIGIGLFDTDEHLLCVPYMSDTIRCRWRGWGWSTRANFSFVVPDEIKEGVYTADLLFKPASDGKDGPWRRIEHTSKSDGPLTLYVTADAVAGTTVRDTVYRTCAEAADIALNLPILTQTEQTYVVRGYVTEFDYDGVSGGQQWFWMADAPDGGKVLQCYWGFVEEEVFVGDEIQLTGHLMNYFDAPEMPYCSVTLIERHSDEQALPSNRLDNPSAQAGKVLIDGHVYIRQADRTYTLIGIPLQ